MKKKNKTRKSLSAMGAVVAAGLTPGIASGSPAALPTSADVELTAADAVVIGDVVFDFDDLLAMQQINRDPRDIPKVYGPPPASMDKKDKARQDSIIREKMRQDSIRRVRDSHALVYGPPPPRHFSVNPERLRNIAADDLEDAKQVVTSGLMTFIQEMMDSKGGRITPVSHFTRDLKMTPSQLQELTDEVENRYGVQISQDMLKQLNNVLRLTDFIITVVKPVND